VITITRIRAEESDRYRGVRLRALADAPSAFATTLDQAMQLPDEVWHDRTNRASTGVDSTLYLAVDAAGDDVGMIAAIRNTVDPSTAELISLWVAPSARRSGAGAELVRHVIDWASESGYDRVELWVARGNDSAERLYRRLGFTETGDVKPLPSDPCTNELRMRRELEAQTS
jgi:ribosomal protein S18 acetylase RimI-like enzyme